ncbi:MAG: hypothetical protein B7X65_13855 [Polaromonas sp. 39-63-25]|nr:MAG: hypothetical protein B7Y28_12605 [Polaromonas sp. 16-63-31]OYZ77504.1 MAG: hypothetical protein B7Y09_16135 [Polaromonas sp. 24-63-21]OZA48512.1 MAG: hypothetical protein B7X88_18375 [Polaromonas sp. 17-63-33]OZA87262.1 MAG: hypothetical protein B7X65_13855 [Polaromonas sp. 39-63-25]
MSIDDQIIFAQRKELESLRAELARPLEVAAPVWFGPDEDGIVWPKPAMTTPSPNLAEYFSAPQVRALIAAIRVPVASEDSGEKGRWEQHGEGHWNHYDDQGKLYMQSVSVASPAEPGRVLAPEYRGYANLGTGQYILNHTGDHPAELIISIATEEEKAGRAVGDSRNLEPRKILNPEDMCVRIRFENVAGLDALEQQLRFLREELFATSPVGAGGADWGLDISTGTPILVYKKCSVIESEQARYVLRLIAADAGGAVVMDARPDSFHSDSGECDRVQRVELSGDELALFQQTLEDFADCGETETDYEVLVNWAQRGLLECINFQPTAAAHRMLATSTSTEQKGGAA